MPTCPCDMTLPPDCPPPADLAGPPGQAMGYGEFRAALLRAVAAHPGLAGWTAEAEGDPGRMLLEMWAYVLDVTRFYDARLTDELYLGSALRPVSGARIIRLLGYRPRPATSATALLIAEVEGADPVTVPAGAGFRSEAFDDEPPQVFETLAAHVLDAERNRWALAPVAGAHWPGRILVAAGESGVPKRGMLVVLSGSVPVHASAIIGTQPFTGPDAARYVEVELASPLVLAEGTPIAGHELRLMALSAGRSAFTHTFSASRLVLDGIYPQLRAGDPAVLEVGAALHPFSIAGVSRTTVSIATSSGTDALAPASAVDLPAITGLALTSSTSWRLHFHPVAVGRMTAPARSRLAPADLGAGTRLVSTAPQSGTMISGEFVLRGVGGRGARLTGQVSPAAATGDPVFSPAAGGAPDGPEIQTPAHLFGNLVTVVRGETVAREILGSADATRTENRFKLKKAPLSWIEDASSLSGIRPLIEVRVENIAWERRASLFAAGPQDRVYMLETDAEGNTWVVFGDGARGARPPSGRDNVTASYRHGAGAAKPPPRTITQMVDPVKGVKRVENALPLTGGADAEAPEALRSNAPKSALTLGRAVSVQDFAALALGFPGVANVAAGWTWDARRQRAVVKLWVAEDGGVDTDALAAWLRTMAAEDTPIAVQLATALACTLTVSLAVSPGHPAAETRAAVVNRLADPATGLLAVRKLPIGGVLYRSALVKVIQRTAGVGAITALRLDEVQMDWAAKAPLGCYFDFTGRIMVS